MRRDADRPVGNCDRLVYAPLAASWHEVGASQRSVTSWRHNDFSQRYQKGYGDHPPRIGTKWPHFSFFPFNLASRAPPPPWKGGELLCDIKRKKKDFFLGFFFGRDSKVDKILFQVMGKEVNLYIYIL